MRFAMVFRCAGVVLLVAGAVISGCSFPDSLEAPTWQVALNEVPLFKADTIYVGQDFLSENIHAGANDVVTATFASETTIDVGDQLKLDPVSTSFFGQVGNLPQGQPIIISGQVPVSTAAIQVQTAEVAGGTLFLTFRNNQQSSIPRNLIVDYQLLNVTRNGQAIVGSTPVPQGGVVSVPENLAGAVMQLNGGGININLQIHIQSGSSTVQPTHSFVADIATSQIQLETVTGTFNLTTSFPVVSENLFDDLPVDGLDSLDLDNATVRLVYTALPFATSNNLLIRARRPGRTDRTVAAAFSTTANTARTVTLDKNGQDNNGATPTVVGLFRMLPEQIEFGGTVAITGTTTLARTTPYRVDVTVDVPFTFSLQTIETESLESINLAEFAEETIRDNVLSASLEGEIENWTPFQGSVRVLIGATPNRAAMTDFIDPITVAPGVDANGDTFVDQPGTSPIAIDFTGSKAARLDALIQSNYFMTVFSMGVPQKQSVTAGDIIIIKNVFLSGQFDVDPENLKDRAND